MTRRTRAILAGVATLALAIGAGAATAGYTVATDADWTREADRRVAREAERDAVRDDVAAQERRLRAAGRTIGADPIPVHDEPIKLPRGTRDSVLGGDTAAWAFTDVFVDEGIVLQGVDAEEVDELPLHPRGTIPPRPQKPITAKPGSRLVKVTLRVTNRTGDAADPACGLAGSFNGSAFTTRGTRAQIAQSFDVIGTYTTACGAGIPDGASANIVLPVGMKDGERLTSLQFLFLGEDSDDYAPLLVLDEPV